MKETLADVFEIWYESRLKDMHTCLPAKIETYDESKRKAKIKIQVKLRVKKGEALDIPPIDNVPVHFLSSKKFKLVYPLEKGDSGIVVFSEEGIGSWLKSTDVVIADSFAKFSLTDAIFIPGIWSFNNIPSDEQTTIIIDKDGNMAIDGKEINLNSGDKGVARLNDTTLSDISVDNAFWTMWNAFFTIVTGPPIPEPGLGAPSALQTAMAAAISAAGGTASQLASKIDKASETVKAGD